MFRVAFLLAAIAMLESTLFAGDASEEARFKKDGDELVGGVWVGVNTAKGEKGEARYEWARDWPGLPR